MNTLLAGRFRPALRFATRGPPHQAYEADLSVSGMSRLHRRARFLKLKLTKEDAMTKRSEAKYKIDRRMGQNIWGRPKSPVNKREYGPGQHGQRRKGKLSDFGTQLRAKQKLKGYYANISERQFYAVYVEATRLKGDLART
jgi:small subunit ribosomal protein S4